MPYDFTNVYKTPEQQQADTEAGDVFWSDYFKTLRAGVTDVAGAVPSAMRWAGESMSEDNMLAARGQELQRNLGKTASDLTDSMSGPAKAHSLATLGSKLFWQHPFSVVGLKATRTAPSIAASIGATLFTPGGIPAAAAIAAMSGGLSAGETLTDMYAAVDSMDDKSLRDNSTLYDGYRKMGLSEDKARKELNRAMIGYKPLGLFALGAVTGELGPAGQIAGALGRTGVRKVLEHGIAKRVGAEAAQGFGAEFVQGGAEQLAQEQAGVDARLQSAVNVGNVAYAAFESGALGGLFGATAGVPRGHPRVQANTPPSAPTTNANPRPAAPNPPAATVAANVTGPPSMPARTGNTQASPGVVPASTPTGPNKTIPGKTARDRKASKKATPSNPEMGLAPTEAPTEALGAPATPALPAVFNAATGLPGGGNVPSNTAASPVTGDNRIVMDDAQQLALNADKPKTPSQVQQQTGAPYGEAANIAEQGGWQAPQAPQAPVLPAQVSSPTPPSESGPMPAPGPTASVVPATTPAEGFGAGTISVSPEQGVAEPAPQFGAGTIAVPVPRTPNIEPRVAPNPPSAPLGLPEPAPTDASRAIEAMSLVKQQAEKGKAAIAKSKADKRTGKHDKAWAEKLVSDAKVAQRLLEARPREITIPKDGNALEIMQKQFQDILDQAKKAGVKHRDKVGYETTPDHVVWLQALDTTNEILKGKKPTGETKTNTLIDFLNDENSFITSGNADALRNRRRAVGEAIQQGRQRGIGTVEGVADTSKQAATEEEAAKKESVEGQSEPEFGGKASSEDVETKVPGTARGPVKLEVPTVTRKVKLLGGEVEKGAVAKAGATHIVSEEVKKAIAERTAKENIEAIKKKAAEAPTPKEKVTKIKEKAKELAKVEAKNVKEIVADKQQVLRDWVDNLSKEDASHLESVYGGALTYTFPDEARTTNFPEDILRKWKGALRRRTPISVKVTPEALAKSKAAAEARKTPPKPSGKAALADELAKIDPNPSDAQIEADNAEKGHISIGGLSLAISTRANTERQIVTAEGRRIGRLYKYSYGHILGTEAPDGQPIDIFLGPKAWPRSPLLKGLPVVVINQVDPDTKVFDEPKVMFGFDTVVDAADAYEDSYPRGAERRGDTVIMTYAEFMAWKNSKAPATEPAGVVGSDGVIDDELASDTDPAIKHDYREPEKARAASLERQFNKYMEHAETTKQVVTATAVSSGKLSDYLGNSVKALRSNDWLPPVSKAIFGKFASRIQDMAGEVKVYVVPKEVYLDYLGRDDSEVGYYSHGADVIIFNEAEVVRGMTDPEVFSYILHEGVHAAIMKAIYANPELHAKLQDILVEARNAALKEGTETQYGLTDVDELIAEALSNYQFQAFLARAEASPGLKARLGLSERITSMWDDIVRIIGQALRLPAIHNSLLSAVMKVTPQLEHMSLDMGPGISKAVSKNIFMGRRGEAFSAISDPALKLHDAINNRLPAQVKSVLKTNIAQQEQLNAPWAMGLLSTDHLAQKAKQFGKEFGKEARTAVNINEAIGVTANEYAQRWLPLAEKMRKAEYAEHRVAGEWEALNNLMHDEGTIGADSSVPLDHKNNKHLGKDTLRGAYPKANWAQLNDRWRALPDDLKALRLELLEFYAARQNDMRFTALKNILRGADKYDDALAQRMFDGTETEADISNVGPRLYDHIQDTGEYTKLKGPYYPQMRRGDYVAQARFKIKPPTNALREIPDEDGYVQTWEFAGKGARKQAMDYAGEQTDLHPTLVSIWVDANTGERYYTDANGVEQKISPKDTDAENRFRVTIENRFVEFYRTKREAREVSAALENDPTVEQGSVKGAEPRRWEPNDRSTDLLSHNMRQMASTLENKPGFKFLSAREQNTVRQTLRETSLRMMSSTRIQTRRMPRNHVLGASRDSRQALVDYINSAAGYLSRLEHQQNLDDAMKRMEADVGTDQGKAFGKRSIFTELSKRINANASYNAPGDWSAPVNRMLIATYAARLISPATDMLNMLQTITTSLPVLSATFGPGRASAAMLKASRDIKVGRILRAGVAATGRAIRSGADAELPSIIEDFKSSLKDSQERSMIDRLVASGTIDPDAGIEAGMLQTARDGFWGYADRALDYISRFGRQMPRAIEAVNRGVTALAAFRLEMQRTGGDYEASVQFAQETTNMTQGIYSKTNTAPIFNHPLGRLSFQFKQYAVVIYGLIGHQIGKAYRNAEPGDRWEATKTLGYMAAVQTVVAGALGLPTEPIKWLLLGAGMAGLPVPTPDEVEELVREMAASALGKTMGEIVTRGVSRALPDALAFDLSSRAGYQDLATFGEPRSLDDPQDLLAYFGGLVGGASGGLAMDWLAGSQALFHGKWLEATEKLSSLKVAADLIKSYRIGTEGKKSGAGYESMSPYSLGEAGIRAFGFTPAREAETGEQSRYFYSEQKRGTKEREEFMQQWAAASGTDRAKLWGQVEKFNYKKTSDERLTRSELDKYTKSRRTQEKTRKGGLKVTRREKALYQRLQGVYNAQ